MSRSRSRQHINPVEHAERVRYRELKRREHAAHQSQDAQETMISLSRLLDDGSLAVKAAERLLSEYTWAELGPALYMRCRRALNPTHDKVRAKVARSKPGRLNREERREYRQRKIVESIKARL